MPLARAHADQVSAMGCLAQIKSHMIDTLARTALQQPEKVATLAGKQRTRAETRMNNMKREESKEKERKKMDFWTLVLEATRERPSTKTNEPGLYDLALKRLTPGGPPEQEGRQEKKRRASRIRKFLSKLIPIWSRSFCARLRYLETLPTSGGGE